MMETVRNLGLEVVRAAHCDFGSIAHVLARVKVKPHNNMLIVVADAALSALMGWNNR